MKRLSRFIPYQSLSAYAIVVAFSVLLVADLSFKAWENDQVIVWDVTSYYGYLPAAFIHHDVRLNFTNKDRAGYSQKMQFWPETATNGGKVIKMTMGMAILYSPFFSLAHLIAKTQGYTPDGFSRPYHRCIHFSSLFYVMIGLIFLRKLLLQLFHEYATAVVIISIALGTNLFYYTTIESAMSHAYSFSLVAVFLYYCMQWHRSSTLANSLFIGFVGGLIVLIRPVNILIFTFPLFLYISSWHDLAEKTSLLWARKQLLLCLVIAAFLSVLPQLLYWKYVTGDFIYYSYSDERFFFNNPHIIQGFLSYRKGWLVYTPIMVFSLLGLYSLYKIKRSLLLVFVIFIPLYCYVIFSWWCWWYGGGFGLRAMIDAYALLAIPMAAFFQQVFDLKNKWVSSVLLSLVCVLVYINVVQSQQYRSTIIHYDAMSKDAYWMNFMETEDVDWSSHEKALVHPNYEKAIKGQDE